MTDKIKQSILELGADVCGIAGIERFQKAPEGYSPLNLFKGCKSVITFGLALPKGLTEVEPRLLYGHYNAFCCKEADRIAFQSARILEKEYQCFAVPLPCDSPYEYWDQEALHGRGLISMKHLAVLSGLGTIGRNSLLLNPQYGTLLTIGALLTNLELKSDELCEPVCIPGCSKCMDSCPAGAIQNGSVDQKLCRTHTYGKTARGYDTVDCNQCRIVCPMKYGIKKF